MEEKFLRNTLYSKIAKRKPDAITNLWHIDDFIAHALSILYPYVRDNAIENIEKFQMPIEVIKNIRKHKNDKLLLDGLTELSLIEALKDGWINRIEDKIKLVSVFIIVQSADESNYIHLKEKLFETYYNAKTSSDSVKYGCNEYIKDTGSISESEKDSSTANPSEKIKLGTVPKKEVFTPTSKEELEFNEFWIKNKLPDTLQKGEFIWQFRIDSKTYKQIKDGLLSLNLKDNWKIVKRQAFRIVVFLAEWYKREYDGFLCERGLEQIGLDSSKSRRIWEEAKLPSSYLINSGQNEWLFSIYVLGGFPAQYVKRTRRFDSLFKDIWTIRQEEEIDEETIDIISESFDSNIAVYKQSMMQNGSLYAYINCLLQDDYPVADTDKKLEPFETFIQQLDEGKKQCYDNFFTNEWIFYTDGESNDIDCEFKVQIGNKKNRCYIPYDCVKSWNREGNWNNLTDFVIGLETNNGKHSRETVRFSKTGNDKSPFVGWGSHSSLSMDLDFSEVSEIKVCLYLLKDRERNNGRSIHVFKARNHYQIFQDENAFKWSTKTNNATSSALIYTSLKYVVNENSDELRELVPTQDSNGSWNWLDIHDTVTLTDVTTGIDYTFSSKKGSLGIVFRQIPGVRYNKNNEINYTCIDSESKKEDSLPVMLGYDGIKSVKLYPFERDEKVQTIKKYKIEYKQNTFHYQELNNNSDIKCGVIQLRISDDLHALTTKCYFIPLRELFQRNTYGNYIKFTSNKINVWSPDNEGGYLLNTEPCSYADEDYDNDSDVIPFRIGTEQEYITLDIFRAKNCREIYFNNHSLTTLSRSSNLANIPLINKDKYGIRTIDDQGVTRTTAGKNIVLDYEFKLPAGQNKEIYYDDEDAGIRYYLYKNMLNRNQLLGIKQDYKDEYRFYYWSMNPQENPVYIDTEYDIDKKGLALDFSRLHKHRHGIIFQSLKGCNPPNYVFPFYSHKDAWGIVVNENMSKETLFKCIDLALEHKVYFSQFYPLMKMVRANENKKQLVELIIEYLQIPGKRTQHVLAGLHRFANEFLFEWFLLPWSIWKDHCRNQYDKRSAELLFRSNPFVTEPSEKLYLDMILNLYWNLPHSRKWNFSRNNTAWNIALQCIRGKTGDFFFLKTNGNKDEFIEQEHSTAIQTIKDLHQNKMLYKELYKVINEKIKPIS